jgi:dihydropteroate synthase
MTQSLNYEPQLHQPLVTLGARTFDFDRSVAVVGIVNRTPDSFYDRGSTFGLDACVAAAEKAIAEGADWIDVGGAPFGPGPEVTIEEEIERVAPVVAAIRAISDVVISADTTNSAVAAAAFEAGADVVNDTSGLYDPRMAAVVAAAGGAIVLVHSAAPPRTAVHQPRYVDVVSEVRDFLETRIQLALDAGVAAERIIIDPGHDLHKNTYHSLELTRRLTEIAALNYPLFVAVSNKDFIGETLDASIDQRVAGSVAVATVCMLRGARMLRVHNVAETVGAVRAVSAILGWSEPVNPRHNMG